MSPSRAYGEAEVLGRIGQAGDHTAQVHAVTAALCGALTRDQVVEVTVEQGVQALGARAGSVGVLDEDGTLLQVRALGYSAAATAAWQEIPLGSSFPLTDVVRSGEYLFLRNAEERLARFPHLAELVRSNGNGAMACVPLLAGGRPFGALGLNFAEPRAFSADERSFILTLARLCGQALERAQLFDSERRSRERLELLSEASRVLGSSLDYELTLRNVAGLALPLLADFCFFDLREQDGQVRRISRAHENPQVQAILEQTRWLPIYRPEQDVCALISERSCFHPRITDAWMRQVAVSPEHLEMMRSLSLRSMISVPLSGRGAVFGSLTLCFGESGRHHTRADLTLSEELARRGASAVENSRLFREATRAVALRDEFLSIAGHELNTPLTTLKLQLTTMAARAHEPAQLANRVQSVHRQVDRLVRQVGTLLDVSRLSAGRLILERERLDLAALTREVAGHLAPQEGAEGCITLEAPECLELEGDRLRLEQVVGNLLSNALKYGAGRPVEVRLVSEAGQARLSVRDQGIGIPPEHHARIFERFERAVSTRHFGGFGVGLWIVREVVHAHGGSVRVESASGQGATFIVELPRSVETP
jgi:signal transduction histidine kinase